MIQGIQSSSNINSYFSSEKKSNYTANGSLNSFETEDTAIISAQAKILNELDKYNAGQSDELNLALTCITSKNQVKAVARVISTKKEMLDTIMDSF
ncbi:MAG: hypothetical protein A2039_04650 [Candidatus Melainabacteria bacterium GWA2_34_9]|nr:MAG: hypothetical protein A2039_04650 [Candidatus Melainabacteria bacterium GWA2_34_9]